MENLAKGIYFLEKNDFRLLEEIDSNFGPDYLSNFLRTVSIADYFYDSLVHHGCSEYDIMRVASLLALIAVKSYDTVNSIYGYNIEISSSDTVVANRYITVDDTPIIHVNESWHDDATWKILYIDPSIIRSSDDDYILEAIIKSYAS